ncbi:hypothetical protein C8046_03935 [Serinibacter arcticus]|uniref:Uncharacterized protein n=1 Tax=Serinibacter arcticus TaxID=1655435 RepID=A0A2U1ZSJ4_9MICO|nr:hypothetical protein [Serinibacter arcticus]PWD49955.1 hypothetical protein C8046_03935 [Serinibacter arcticus]
MARQAWEIPRNDVVTQTIVNAVSEPGRFPLDWVDAPESGPIPVTVRLLWAIDGEEWVTARARAWTRSLVLVELRDPRWRVGAAWLPARDVRRAEAA